MKQVLFTSLILAALTHLEPAHGQVINKGKYATRTFTSSREQGNVQVNYEAKHEEKSWTPKFTSKVT